MSDFLIGSLERHIGQTVTIFTTSGGLSGRGFTGVLAGICGCNIKLITDIGAPPSCPIGSACCGGFFEEVEEEREFGGSWGGAFGGMCEMFGRCRERCGCREGGKGRRRGRWHGRNWLGSITVIPIDRIASFTHHAL